jgi:hypothetical protein
MPSFIGNGRRRESLDRAQMLGIRTSTLSVSLRGRRGATVVVIACIVAYALRSSTKDLTRILSHSTQIESHDACPSLRLAVVPNEESADICSPRGRHKWRDDLDRYFEESTGRMPTFAVVLTVNSGYWDFFVNWHRHFRKNSKRTEHVLIIIAEDASINGKLEALFDSATSVTIVLPGYDIANDHAHHNAEDYDSVTYKVGELFLINVISLKRFHHNWIAKTYSIQTSSLS